MKTPNDQAPITLANDKKGNIFNIGVYKEPATEYVKKHLLGLEKRFKDVAESLNIPIFSDQVIMEDVIKEVHKARETWFFLNTGTQVNNLKIACIYAYYIGKLKPLSINSDKNRIKTTTCINEIVGLTLALFVLKKHRKSKGEDICISKTYFNELITSMRYENISSDALIHLLELFLHHDVKKAKDSPTTVYK